MIYNTNVDFVNDNVYTKFVLNRSIRFQDIEQKLNYGGMTERLTERKRGSKNNGQGESSIAPTFSKRGYKDRIRLYLSKRYQSQSLKKNISPPLAYLKQRVMGNRVLKISQTGFLHGCINEMFIPCPQLVELVQVTFP